MTDVFNNDSAPSDVLSTLVGEYKKFKDVESLAKGKAEADAFIASLQAENQKLRGELDPQFNAKEELAKLRAELEANRANPSGGTPKGPVTPEPLTVDRIAAIVNETITKAEQNRTAQQNVSEANAAVIKQFGTQEAAGTAVQAKAAELGLSLDDLRRIAEKSPSAFQKIILGEPVAKSDGPLNPAIAPKPAPNAQAPTQGTAEWFDHIFRTDRKRFFTPEIQVAYHKAVTAGTIQL